MPPPLTASTALRLWQFAPAVSAVLVCLAAGYLGCALRVGRRHPARPWPARSTAAFLGGLAVAGLATQSSIGVYDDVLFSAHMVQHLLLIMVAPVLLAVGRPVTLLLHSFGNPVHSRVKRAVRSRAAALLTWPPGVTAGYCVVVAATHLTPLMNLTVENTAVHDAEHVLYLVTGYLFFGLVVGGEPVRPRFSPAGRFLMLLVAMPVDTLTGVILMLVPRELFPAYARAGRAWGPGLLADLHAGGIIMWVGSDTIMIVLAIAVAVAMVRDPAARTAYDGARLAAYNAALSALGAGAPGSLTAQMSTGQASTGQVSTGQPGGDRGARPAPGPEPGPPPQPGRAAGRRPAPGAPRLPG